MYFCPNIFHLLLIIVIFQVDILSVSLSDTFPVEAPLTRTKQWSTSWRFPLPRQHHQRPPSAPAAAAGVCLLHPPITILRWSRVPTRPHHPGPSDREIRGRPDNTKPWIHPHICILPCPAQEGNSTQPGPFDPEKARRAAALSRAGGGHG